MPALSSLLATIDITYRNTFSVQQKVEWMDITQKQIFQKVKHDAMPWFWVTEDGEQYYDLPDNCDVHGITKVTIETAPGSNKFNPLGFVSIQSTDNLANTQPFYSTLERYLFLNPAPNENTEGRKVYLYYTKRPANLIYTTTDQIPDLNEDFHELLILGCLERIARARGEMEDKNTFAADFTVLMRDYEKQYMRNQPGYGKIQDAMKLTRRGTVYTRHGRNQNWDLVPDNLMGGG